MEVLLFFVTQVLPVVLVICALILVHEFGHFVVAKLSGMRVDEFGLGFPPRALTLATVGGTRYTLNWLPFGGFVRIYGENPAEEGAEKDPRSFAARPRVLQALVLLAGITMNLLFAYVLITGALIAGTPRALAPSEVAHASHEQLAVAQVLAGSPAMVAGLVPGDTILSAKDAAGAWQAASPQSFSAFVEASKGDAIELSLHSTSGQAQMLTVKPVQGLVPGDPSRYALGVEVATIGVVPLSFGAALMQGATLTWGVVTLTASGLGHFFASMVTFTANLSQVSGPVGIVRDIGSASTQGFGDLLSLTAIISVNLALINLIPIPALDGGRLLIVLVEGVLRRPIAPRLAQAMNIAGFAFLALLMLVVTAHDLFALVS